MADPQAPDNNFWRRAFFANDEAAPGLSRQKHDVTVPRPTELGAKGDLWLQRLFRGVPIDANPGDKMTVLKNGVVVHEIPLLQMGQETVIGRHPSADLQLESYKLAMYHVAILQRGGKFYVEGLDLENGALLDRKKIKPKTPVPLHDGSQVDLPGFRLEFTIADTPPPTDGAVFETEDLDEIPSFFYAPPAPPAGPLLVNLIENREQLSVWSEGVTSLKVVDIIEETHDAKTFCLAGEKPLLFSYHPGQFITFILNINGQEVKRSYSMSSSPSRPHLLEVTIKCVPGGLVSNWFYERVKLGDILTVKGPSGKFTCFNYPSRKMLFIGAGSGITPIVSMGRWIADTGADVDVKLLASFKSPSDIIFRKEFELWAARKRNFQVAISLTSNWHGTDYWTGFTGRINEHMLNVFVPDLHERHVFMCGPEPFSDSVKKLLRDIGFNLANLHTESFGSGRSAQGSRAGGKTLELKGAVHKVTFAKSGIAVDCDEHVSLLELAEANGIEIEYSCRTGSCGACEVKCKGDTKVSKECEIDAKTRAAGFVYACCTRALGDLELDA
jgi:ferredoxin-NADP reductase/pSer/pThr/pTyr-binding forkhead associated (FHA) protein